MTQFVTGSGNMILLLMTSSGNHDVSPTSLFRTAQSFYKAAEAIDPVVAAAPFGFVAAQCLELALKTFLMKKAGMTEEDLINKVGHDLRKAWLRCVQNGLPLDAKMPSWAAYLGAGHRKPYRFRYGRNNTGMVLASKATILDQLRQVLAIVQTESGVT